MVQEVERIHTELQVLIAKRCEVLEQRHVDGIVAGAVDRVRSAAEQLGCRSLIRYRPIELIAPGAVRRTDQRDGISWNRIGEGARVIPMLPCPCLGCAFHTVIVDDIRGGWPLRRGFAYPAVAPIALATCRKTSRKGKDVGKCSTMRRAEATTIAPSFNKRSRSVHMTAQTLAVVLDHTPDKLHTHAVQSLRPGGVLKAR